MPGGTWPPKTALIVDDDHAIREYVGALLTRLNIHVDTAIDGMEAEEKLRKGSYDLLFQDLDLPHFSGKFILELLQRGRVPRPGWIFVMSAAEKISEKLGAEWPRFGVSEILTKPFGAADVTKALDRIRATANVASSPPAEKPPVVVVGSGEWITSVTKAVTAAGGSAHATTREGAFGAFEMEPMVIVIGPPLQIPDIIGLVLQIPEERRTRTHVVAVMEETNPAVHRDLLTIGVRAVSLTAGLPWLCGDVTRLAGLQAPRDRSSFERPIMLRAANTVYIGRGVELSEDGVSATFMASEAPVPPMILEFELEESLVEAGAAISSAQSMPDGTARVTFSFAGISDEDVKRIRRHVFANTR